MNELEQLQLFLDQTMFKYERCIHHYGLFSIKTQKVGQQLHILWELKNEYLNQKKHPAKDAGYIQIYAYSTIEKHIN
ncbi:hypothetical protein [Priestia filamentosa]|uniref:hypothetical protein n=1 Tax=Priestia filamentosa TaxID=1402861 RepID=UPI000A08517D|nr:hypothetical protein [Priestia filamentosa]OXS69850.1 hypothetical protein B1B01_12935 [Priestia filamentosa]SMF37165.1 hypothetical protein SAMN06296056_1021167 [Priestia filamentosa]